MRPDWKRVLFLDFETETDGRGYSLARMSTDEYVADSRFAVLGVGVAEAEGQVKFYPWARRSSVALDEARSVIARKAAEGFTCVAHNAFFEATILERRWGVSFEHYFDTMGYLRFLGIGGSLANGARFFGYEKLPAPEFSRAKLMDAAASAVMARYCATDVALTRKIFANALGDPWFPDIEFYLIDRTIRMNLEGLPVDGNRLDQVRASLLASRDAAISTFSATYAISPGSLGSVEKVKRFLRDHLQIDVHSLDQRDADLIAQRAANPALNRFLELRETIQASAKYADQLDRWRGRRRVVGYLNYYGSHTGRFSSGGRDSGNFNVHNIPKGHALVPEMASIRTALVPPAERHFVSGDLSQIEARVCAFLAGEQEQLEKFRAGEDVYLWFAEQVFPGLRVVKGGENDHLRQAAKQAILGLGFGMGEATFLKRLAAQDPCFDLELGRAVFQEYRRRFRKIGEYRADLWAAFQQTYHDGISRSVGLVQMVRQSNPAHQGDVTMAVWLPSQRPLFYRSVRKTWELTSWQKMADTYWYAENFDSAPNGTGHRHAVGAKRTRKFDDGRVRTLLMKQTLIENAVQGVARDILMHQMRDLEQIDGLVAAFHVHDELVLLSDQCRCDLADGRDHEGDCPWKKAQARAAQRLSVIPSSLPLLRNLPIACEMNLKIRTGYGK